jgi:tripartite ATP-independent transporter DctM subunit
VLPARHSIGETRVSPGEVRVPQDVALPALESRRYSTRASLGSLAAGGTLGILIPPSINLLVYGSLTNTSVGQLFAAGLIPGILLALCFSLYILAFERSGEVDRADVPLAVKLAHLRFLVPPMVIFLVVMGSIYGGLATPTESAALGVVIALGFVTASGRLSLDLLATCSMQAARTTGIVVIVLACALLLNVTISMLGVTQAVTQWVGSFGLDRLTLLLVLILFYLVLGAFLDAMSMLVLTVPIAVPMMAAVGVDPIWFGIFIVLMCEIALITPPVGMNLFVMHGVRRDGGSFAERHRRLAPLRRRDDRVHGPHHYGTRHRHVAARPPGGAAMRPEPEAGPRRILVVNPARDVPSGGRSPGRGTAWLQDRGDEPRRRPLLDRDAGAPGGRRAARPRADRAAPGGGVQRLCPRLLRRHRRAGDTRAGPGARHRPRRGRHHRRHGGRPALRRAHHRGRHRATHP